MVLNFPVFYRTMDIKGDAIVASAIQQAVADAEQLWKPEIFDGVFPIKGFGIRRLVPRDICSNSGSIYGPSNSTWVWSCTTASTWETWVSSGILSDSCYIVITGIFNYDAAPDVDVIKITADGVEYPLIDLQELYGWDIAVAYFSHPIIVRPEKKIHITAKAQTAGQKKIGLIGYTIAKRSYLIGQI